MKSLKIVALAASLTFMVSGIAHAKAPYIAHRSQNVDLSQSGCVDNAVALMKENKFSPVLTSKGTYVVGSYGENKAIIVCQTPKGLVSFIASGPNFSVATCIAKGLLKNFKAEEEGTDTDTGTGTGTGAGTSKGCPFS